MSTSLPPTTRRRSATDPEQGELLRETSTAALSTTSPQRRRRRAAPWIAAGAAVAVTAAVASGWSVSTGSADAPASDPPLLHIGTPAAGLDGSEVQFDPDGASSGRFLFTGQFPSGPSYGTAWTFTSAQPDLALVQDLAAALGLTSPVRRDGSDWVVEQNGQALRVYDAPGLPFAFDADDSDGACPGLPVTGLGGPDTSLRCAVGPEPTAVPTGPTESELRRQGRSLASSLNLAANTTVWPGSPFGTVMLQPSIGGVAVDGMATTLQIGASGVLAGSGWLAAAVPGAVVEGDTYPLRAAQDVFGDLGSVPSPAIACPEVQDQASEGSADLSCGGPVTLTSVAYGLQWAYDNDRPVLVPAWLWTVAGSDTPLSTVAVETRFLAEPVSDDASGSGSSTPGSPGSAEPGQTGLEAKRSAEGVPAGA